MENKFLICLNTDLYSGQCHRSTGICWWFHYSQINKYKWNPVSHMVLKSFKGRSIKMKFDRRSMWLILTLDRRDAPEWLQLSKWCYFTSCRKVTAWLYFLISGCFHFSIFLSVTPDLRHRGGIYTNMKEYLNLCVWLGAIRHFIAYSKQWTKCRFYLCDAYERLSISKYDCICCLVKCLKSWNIVMFSDRNLLWLRTWSL